MYTKILYKGCAKSAIMSAGIRRGRVLSLLKCPMRRLNLFEFTAICQRIINIKQRRLLMIYCVFLINNFERNL